jgi:hypothetical protein
MRHGDITEEEAAVHPQRHILTRALGISSEVETDMWELALRAGDRLILCSDGLSNELSNQEMADVLATVPDPSDAAHQLVDIANEHGGSDNITVVVVDVLVGEGAAEASVITPIGARAGAPLVVTPAISGDAPVGLLGAPVAGGGGSAFTTQLPAVRRDGPRTGEFFPDTTQAVPVARATLRSTVRSPPPSDTAPPNESRGARRRRLGVPRRITLRVVLFVLLVAAVPTGAFYAIRWYAYDNWFLSIQKNRVVVQQGHPAGVLWFHPKVVYHSRFTTAQLLPTGVAQIRGVVQEPSFGAAKKYVTNLHHEYLHAQAVKSAARVGSGETTTTLPGTRPSSQTTSSGSTPRVAPGLTTTAPTTATATTSVVAPAVGSTTTPTTAPTTVTTTAPATTA